MLAREANEIKVRRKALVWMSSAVVMLEAACQKLRGFAIDTTSAAGRGLAKRLQSVAKDFDRREGIWPESWLS